MVHSERERRLRQNSFVVAAGASLPFFGWKVYESADVRVAIIGVGMTATWLVAALLYSRLRLSRLKWVDTVVAVALAAAATFIAHVTGGADSLAHHVLFALPFIYAVVLPKDARSVGLGSACAVIGGFWLLVEDGRPAAFVIEWLTLSVCGGGFALFISVALERTLSKHFSDLRDAERQSRAIFEASMDAMLIADDDARYVDANAAACRLLERSREEVLRCGVADFLPEDQRPHVSEIWRAFRDGGTQSGTLDLVVNGKRKVVEFAATANYLPGRHLSALRDVTEKRQLEARLAMTDRMVTVGTLAAGVAHELNNPLSFVRSNIDFVRRELRGTEAAVDSELVDALDEALVGADRMRVIVNDLKTFSRGDDETVGAVDLQQVLSSCISMAHNELKHRAQVTTDFGVIRPVHGNAFRLGQVFLNLLINAAQAIPQGAALSQRITVRTRSIDGRTVVVEVSDTGCGIPSENLHRIFDPFFTTKPVGVGTGLGLSICHGIIQKHGGTIQVESTVGAGTTFRVTLPAMAEEHASDDEAAEQPAAVA